MYKLEFKKETDKALYYIIGDYRIRISKKDYYVIPNAHNNLYIEDDIEDQESNSVPACDIRIENGKSKAFSTRRCCQHFKLLLKDIEKDFNGSKKQFRWR